MSKRKPSYTRDNVQCNARRAYVEAKGLQLGATELKGSGCILVTVKQVAPRNKWEREFCHWTMKFGIQVRATVQGAEATWATREWLEATIAASGSATLECYGSAEALEALVTMPCVEKWDWMLSGGPNVRLSGQGQGEAKQKATKPKPKATITCGPTAEDRGENAKPNDMTKWESHTDAMGKLVKGVASLPE